MIRITLMDGTVEEIARADARALVPYSHVFTSPFLREPIAGVFCYGTEPRPLVGPLPREGEEKNAWILVLGDHGQVIRGYPEFLSGAKVETQPTVDEQSDDKSIEEIANELKDLLNEAA